MAGAEGFEPDVYKRQGLNSTEIPVTTPDTPSASASDLFMAIRLGTSSPKISVK